MLCLEAKKEGDDTEKSLVCCAVCLKRRVVDIGGWDGTVRVFI